MSTFLPSTAGPSQRMMRADYMNPTASDFDWCGRWDVDTQQPWADAALWPNSRALQGVSYFGNDVRNTNRFGTPPDELGGSQMKKLIGTTCDNSGAPLGGCVVHVYLTANDQFLRSLTSDAGGYFEMGSEYDSVAHYLVAYKPGSPDVAGTTVNTLIPA